MKSMKWWMARYKKSSKIALVLMLITVVAATSACSIFPKEAEEEEVPIIEPPKISKKPETVVTRGDIQIVAKGSGSMYSNTEEFLYFVGTEKDGSSNPGNQNEMFRIKSINVQPGDRVTTGQVLAALDTKDLDLLIEKSASQLKIDEYHLIQQLREEVNTIEEQIALEEVKAAFRAKQIEHEKLVRQMQNSQIIAPIDGMVFKLFYSSGDQVKAYDPVLLIIDDQDLVAGVRITESEQKLLTIGQEASVEINGVDGVLVGTIVRMPLEKKNQNYDPWNPNYRPTNERDNMVLIDVHALPEQVKRGTVANGQIVLQHKADVVKVPLAFLHTYGERTYVIVSDDQGRREVDVELGLRSAREVEIVAGVEAGVTIIGR